MEVREIQINKILGSLCRMRLERDYEKEEMLTSIAKCGVMNPIKVKKVKDGYKIFAGHRRLDCAKELGHKTVPAEIWEGLGDREAVMMGFVDNINRKDFTPLEEAHAYRKMMEEYGWKVEEIKEHCGKEESRIYKLVKMLKIIPREMEKAVLEERMSVGHALILIRFEDKELREKLFARVLEGEISVHDLEYLLARQKPDSEKNEKEKILDIVEDAYEADPGVGKLWGDRVKMYRSRRGLKVILNGSGPGELLMMYKTLEDALRKVMPRFQEIVGPDGVIP